MAKRQRYIRNDGFRCDMSAEELAATLDPAAYELLADYEARQLGREAPAKRARKKAPKPAKSAPAAPEPVAPVSQPDP